MDAPYIGEIRAFSSVWEIQGWLRCDGTAYPIAEYSLLFAVITTIYGGNGRTEFCVPNLQCQAPIALTNQPGMLPRYIGQPFGSAFQPMTAGNLPAHSHTWQVGLGTEPTEMTATPSSSVISARENSPFVRSFTQATSDDLTPMGTGTIMESGGSLAHENRQPYLPLLYCINFDGEFPSRG